MNKTDALPSIPWWVVTDLDGTLMDHAYNWEPAREAIRGLQLQGIPVIPCTSKTAEEVKSFRAAAGLKDPFIVENGGAVHGETSDGEPWELALGCPVAELRPVLLELESLLCEPLQPIDALSDQE
nr:HAD hydrolase family protein [Cyanobacteriota bacterium]